MLLCDVSGRSNVLHFSSFKSKEMTRSLKGAEVLAFADEFDYSYLLRYDMQNILNWPIPLAMLTDSESLLKTIVKSTAITTEKLLMIDVSAAIETY